MGKLNSKAGKNQQPAGRMENGCRPVDRTAGSNHRITAGYPELKKKERSKIKRTRGQHFIPAIGLVFRISIVFIFLTDTLIQLASATAVYSSPKPVDTKISGDIIPVGIKVSDNDHLAEALQQQGQQQKDHRNTLAIKRDRSPSI